MVEPVTSEGAVPTTSLGFSLTKSHLQQGFLVLPTIIPCDAATDECILNVGLDNLLGSEERHLPDAFKDVMSLLEKVIFLFFI